MKKSNLFNGLYSFWKEAWDEHKTILTGAELNCIGVTIAR